MTPRLRYGAALPDLRGSLRCLTVGASPGTGVIISFFFMSQSITVGLWCRDDSSCACVLARASACGNARGHSCRVIIYEREGERVRRACALTCQGCCCRHDEAALTLQRALQSDTGADAEARLLHSCCSDASAAELLLCER